MYSKRSWCLILALSFLTTACGDYLRGRKKEPEVIELSDSRFACISDVPDTLENLSKGQGQEAEIQKSFTCLESALVYFKNRTSGSASGNYTAEDFRKFFGKYFLKRNNISKAFSVELIRLKAALLGGDPQIVTKEEVVKLAGVIGILREELISLLDHLPVLLTQAKNPTNTEIDQAIAALKKASSRILRDTAISKSDYNFDHTQALVREILKFIHSRNEKSITNGVQKYWPLLEKFKFVLIGERAGFVGLRDWQDALTSFIDLYDLGLYTHYRMRPVKLDTPQSLHDLNLLAEKAFHLLETSHQMRKRGFIPTYQIDQLVEEISEFTGGKISKDTIKESYKMFIGKLTHGQRFHGAHDFLRLEMEHLHILRKEVRAWYSLQAWVNQIMPEARDRQEWEYVRKNLNSFDYRKHTQKLYSHLSRTDLDEMEQGWKDFKSLLNKQQPQIFNEQSRLMLIYDSEARKVSWGSLSRSSLTYSLTRIMLRGYAEPFTEFQESRVLEKQMIRWYDDFKSLGLELKAFDPRNSNSGSRSFKEANFFMASSNGNDKIEFNEMHEFVSLLLSAGMGSVQTVRHMAADAGCAIDELDAFGLPYFKEDCFKEILWDRLADTFSNLPQMTSYFLQNPNLWEAFYEQAMGAARIPNGKSGYLEHGDVRTFVMIIHYVESLMLTFDKNRDAHLSVDEIELAAPRFLSFMKSIKELPDIPESAKDWALKHGFIFLVAEGREPDLGFKDMFNYVDRRLCSWASHYKWTTWLTKINCEAAKKLNKKAYGVETNAVIEVDRVGLARVFGNLKEELKKSSK